MKYKSSIISEIAVKDKKLLVYWEQTGGGLFNVVPDDKVKPFVCQNTDIAFNLSIHKDDENTYELNIANAKNLYGYRFKWEDEFAKEMLNKQLEAYFPIIQKFIADVMADTLEVHTYKELNAMYGNININDLLKKE